VVVKQTALQVLIRAIVGGDQHAATASRAFIGGGYDNTVSNNYGTVAGGYQNNAY